MENLGNIIKGRRSIRRYQDKDIPEEVLYEVLESVRWAPSWANTQAWEVVVIKDKALKESIQSTVNRRNPSSLALVNAPVLLVICGQLNKSGYYDDINSTKFGDWWFMHDLGLATQNLCLTAHNAGLGTVIVGLFDHDKVGELINLPDNHEVLTLIPLGYPDQKPKSPKRREQTEYVHFEKF